MKIEKMIRSSLTEVSTRPETLSDRIPSFTIPKNHRPPKSRGVKDSLYCMALLPAALFLVTFWGSPSLAAGGDADYPHNSVQNATCNTGTCHSNYGGGSGPDVSLGDIGCLFCHDDNDPTGSLPAPTVVSHSSATTSTKYDTWDMKCIDCHNPHLQMQYWSYGEDSSMHTETVKTSDCYVVSGISDEGGVTENSLTMTGAGWEPGSLAGMVLFPNVEDLYADYSNYGIIGNTEDTITVKGPMLIDGGSWDTPIGTGNKKFAVVYGQLVNSNVPDAPLTRPVRFFRAEGANSFADGDGTYDGICEVCHTRTSHHRKDGTAPDQSHYDGLRCTTCHPHANGFKVVFDHTETRAVVPISPCVECHAGTDPVSDVHGNQCGRCHVAVGGGGPLVEPYESTAPQGGYCTDCHSAADGAHADLHTASPGSGTVVIFADTDHDDAGWVGIKPYFDVQVDCGTCHSNNLISVHANDCSTCHPGPRDTLTTWNGGCQQGACHPSFHEDSTIAHLPFEAPAVGDCSRCHDAYWNVPQTNCLNCHATYGAGDVTPPVTTTNTQSAYEGQARIDFSIMDNGKVGLGRTYYRLDGGSVAAGSCVAISAIGLHNLEFWSVDQAGNTETPTNMATFEVVADIAPPTTITDAKASYNQSATITLTAIDNSSQGVKATYYSLNNGPTQTGTQVVIPAPSVTTSYTLNFWSEDWSGNIETQNGVNFTVIIDTYANLSLVWGNSDVSGSPCGADPEAEANWTILRGTTTVATGSGSCPEWSGVNNLAVSVSPTRYTVIIDWWDSYYEDWDQSRFRVYVTTPGQTIRLSY